MNNFQNKHRKAKCWPIYVSNVEMKETSLDFGLLIFKNIKAHIGDSGVKAIHEIPKESYTPKSKINLSLSTIHISPITYSLFYFDEIVGEVSFSLYNSDQFSGYDKEYYKEISKKLLIKAIAPLTIEPFESLKFFSKYNHFMALGFYFEIEERKKSVFVTVNLTLDLEVIRILRLV